MRSEAATRARLACVVALAWLGCAPYGSPPPGAVRLESMLLRLGETPAPPPPAQPLPTDALANLDGWEQTAIPDAWGLGRRARHGAGWYRSELVLPAEHRGWALLVEGTWESLTVFAETVRLGGAARDASVAPFSSPAAGALLLPLPEGRDRFELLLHYRASPSQVGLLTEVAAGPQSAMAAMAKRRDFLRRTLPNALGMLGLVGGVLVLLLARFSDARGVYWFGLSTSLWCLAFLLPTDPSSALGWLASVLLHGFVPAIAIALHRVLRLERPLVEALLLASALLGALLRAIVPPLFVPAVDIGWWLANFGIGLYVLPILIRIARERVLTGARWVLFAGAALVAGGLHDVASLLAGRTLLVPASLFATLTPVIAVSTAGAIVAALASAMRQVRELNAELERRVEDKRRELAASYEHAAQLERERAIAGERERMMRDMHDGTGGQLVSALSLVEAGEYRPEELAETLRAALADLRLSIDSLESGPPDLLAVLALARTRLEARLEHHGVRFAWEVEDVPTPIGFGPEQSLHVLRIFQEAVTNVLKHARASTITVRTGVVEDAGGRKAACVEIADDGVGLRDAGAAGPNSGRGLQNMQRRAQEIGAACRLTSGPSGTTVRLLLPLEDA